MPAGLTGCLVGTDDLPPSLLTVRVGLGLAAGLAATFAAGLAAGLGAAFGATLGAALATTLAATLATGFTGFLTEATTGLTGFLEDPEALTADFAALTGALLEALVADLAGTFAEVFGAGLAAAIVFLMPVDWVMIALWSLRLLAWTAVKT